MDIDGAIDLVIGLSFDYSIETRIRRLVEAHVEDGVEPRTLVMNRNTWHELVAELNGRLYTNGYFWQPAGDAVSFFRGLPILIKDEIADLEVIIGV